MTKINQLFAKYSKSQKILILVFVVMIFLLNIFGTYNKSLMYDEKCYIGTGKYLWMTGNFFDYNVISYHPPLSFYINSIFLIPLKFDQEAYGKKDCTEVGSIIVFHSGYNPFLIAFLARLPFMILSVILSVLVLKFAEYLYGIKSGVFAMFLYTFSISILSNSNFALTDLLITFTMFFTIYYFWKLNNNFSRSNLFVTGIFFGLALLSKMTSLILIPSMLILSFIEIRRKKFNKKNIVHNIKFLLTIFFIGSIVVWVGYDFSFRSLKAAMPSHYVKIVYKEFDKTFSNQFVKKAAINAFENVPIPAPGYFFSLASVYYRSVFEGREGYFFGKVIEKAPWYYLIVVFMLKTQLSLILLIAIALLSLSGKNRKITNEFYLLVPILLLFFSFIINKNVSGVGYILPVYPFLFVFVSKIVNSNKRKVKVILFLLVVYYFISAIFAFPNYYSYFNELSGGSSNGYKYLGDGNLDNGQNLPQLKKFMIENNINKLNFSYLGSVDPKEYGINYDYMPSPYFQNWVPYYYPFIKPEIGIEDCSKRSGWMAVSASNYQGVYLINRSCFSWLKDYKPVEVIENSIFVYKIKT